MFQKDAVTENTALRGSRYHDILRLGVLSNIQTGPVPKHETKQNEACA